MSSFVWHLECLDCKNYSWEDTKFPNKCPGCQGTNFRCKKGLWCKCKKCGNGLKRKLSLEQGICFSCRNNPNKHQDMHPEVKKYVRETLTKEEYEGFCRGNVLKYVSRVGEDITTKESDYKKAYYYLGELVINDKV